MGLAQLALTLALAAPATSAAVPGQTAPAATADVVAEVAALRAAGRFREAFDLAVRLDDAPLSARLEAEVRWYAGDLDGALAAVREGLVAAPGEALLAWLGTRLALDLDRAALAASLLGSLERAVEAAAFQSTLDDAGRRWWGGELERLRDASSQADAALASRDAALRRARAAALLAAVTALILGLLLARVPARDPGEARGGSRGRAAARTV